MNHDLPSSPSHLEPGSAPDLDERILAAEHAVIERDQRLRRDAVVLGHRLQASARRSGRIAAVAGIGAFLLGWMMARSAPRSRDADDEGEDRRRAPRLAEAPWAGIVPIIWPLLPLAIRSRVSPGLASFVTGIGLPLVAQRMAKKRVRPAAPPPKANGDARMMH